MTVQVKHLEKFSFTFGSVYTIGPGFSSAASVQASVHHLLRPFDVQEPEKKSSAINSAA